MVAAMARPLSSSRSTRALLSAASAATAVSMKLRIAGSFTAAFQPCPSSARLQHQEVLEAAATSCTLRRCSSSRPVSSRRRRRRAVLALAGRNRAFEIAVALRARLEQRARWRRTRNCCARRRPAPCRAPSQTRPAQAGTASAATPHRGIAAKMIEPGGDNRLGMAAIDQRRAERRIRMGPADRYRRRAMTPALDARGEQAEEPAGFRPDSMAPASVPNTGAAASMKAGS